MTQLSTGGYVRHRDRMIQESVLEDLQDTLIACRWMTGTTTRPVISPYDPAAGWQIVTTTIRQVLKLVGDREDGSPAEVVIIDYFPEAGGNDDENGKSRKTELNTLAIDGGVAQQGQPVELGSNLKEQPYSFTMVFYASSDAVARALMNDLRDRYEGRAVSDDHLNLYNFNADEFDVNTPPVVRMEIDGFTYDQNAQSIAPFEVHLYYAELRLTDWVDENYLPNSAPSSGAGFGSPALISGNGEPESGVFAKSQQYLDLDTGDIYEWGKQ